MFQLWSSDRATTAYGGVFQYYTAKLLSIPTGRRRTNATELVVNSTSCFRTKGDYWQN